MQCRLIEEVRKVNFNQRLVKSIGQRKAGRMGFRQKQRVGLYTSIQVMVMHDNQLNRGRKYQKCGVEIIRGLTDLVTKTYTGSKQIKD